MPHGKQTPLGDRQPDLHLPRVQPSAASKQSRARRTGLALAVITRLLLLAGSEIGISFFPGMVGRRGEALGTYPAVVFRGLDQRSRHATSPAAASGGGHGPRARAPLRPRVRRAVHPLAADVTLEQDSLPLPSLRISTGRGVRHPLRPCIAPVRINPFN